MRRIWTVNETPFDTSSAGRHGELLKPIYSRGLSPYDVDRQCRIIRDEVIPFAESGDLILTIGPQVMVAVLVAQWREHFGRVNFLVWDKCTRGYKVVVFGEA